MTSRVTAVGRLVTGGRVVVLIAEAIGKGGCDRKVREHEGRLLDGLLDASHGLLEGDSMRRHKLVKLDPRETNGLDDDRAVVDGGLERHSGSRGNGGASNSKGS